MDIDSGIQSKCVMSLDWVLSGSIVDALPTDLDRNPGREDLLD